MAVKSVEAVEGEQIGQRPLNIFEEGDALLVGLTPEEVARMTPEELEKLADAVVEVSNVLVGA